MAILTFTTDLGTRDHYVAMLKAALLRAVPEVTMVDVTHHIPPFDIARAAFVLSNVWQHFPKGSLHMVAVDEQWGRNAPYVVLRKDGHIFIGTDNGLFSLLFHGQPADEIYALRLQGHEDLSFPSLSVLVPAATELLLGSEPAHLGDPRMGFRKLTALSPVVEADNLRGSVIYIDSYGNVVTNITRELFEKVVGHRPFRIVLRRGGYAIDTISRSYGEVPEGEKLALFTTAGYLEIAVNRGVEGSGGGATQLLGMKMLDVVRVEFEP
jgi:S-adenosylmethionine hydrolase